MATRTIANGGGNFDSTGTWVEGAVPTSADNIVATATSGNLVMNVAGACRSIDLTGYTGTFSGNKVLSIGDGTAPPGSNALVFPASGWTITYSGTFTFVATSGAGILNVDTGGKTIPGAFTFNGTGGSWKFISNVTMGGFAGITLSKGTLNANGVNVTINGFDCNSAFTRSLSMGSGTWTVAGDFVLVGGATFDAGTAPVVLSDANHFIRVEGYSFYSLSMQTTAARTLTFLDSVTVGATNSISLKGVSGGLLTLTGIGTAGWSLAVPSTQAFDYLSVSYSTATGNTASTFHSTDGGNNVNWNFVAPPVADFTGTPTAGAPPLSVAFTYTGTGGTPDSYHWEKDDGSGWVDFAGTPTAQNPTESFAVGTWSVRVTATVSGAGSDTKTRTNYVTANAPGGAARLLLLGAT